MEYDAYGNIRPSLARDWSVSNDGLTYRFHLRRGQKWVNADGEIMAEVTAHDFVSAMRYILTADHDSATASLLFGVIQNARAYYNGTLHQDNPDTPEVEGIPMAFSQVGVLAEDDDTLVYRLEAPCRYFLSSLTYVCYMPAHGPLLDALGSSFGAPTGPDTLYYCGAYRLSEFQPHDRHVYTKNTRNWDADKVRITTITETWNPDAVGLCPEMVLDDRVDYAQLPSDVLDTWRSDPEKAPLISRSRLKCDYSYFYCFNFDPRLEGVYEPENWRLAVNNEDFRKALAAALDRLKAIRVSEPDDPALLQQTVTPAAFASLNGKDYTRFGDLSAVTQKDGFDPDAALAYKEKAMAALSSQGAGFPVKALMPYNPVTVNWEEECLAVERQVEGLLGRDFIDIIPVAGPSDNFLSQTRRIGNYAFMKCHWGADYGDPATFTDPFSKNATFNFMAVALSENTAARDAVFAYYTLVDAAKAQTTDLTARYEALADAEAHLINHAFVIPFSISPMDHQLTRLNVYEGQYAPFGVSVYRYKGHGVYDQIITRDACEADRVKWEQEREAAVN